MCGIASTSRNHNLTVSNLEFDDGSSSELDNSNREQNVNIIQSHISSQSIDDHANNTECENSDMESENVNEDNGGINEEIENERERNEIREDIVTTDSSNNEDNDNSEETNDDESDEAQDDIAQLRQWAIQSCIEHCHLDSLLRILRRRLIPNLPITSKTFLRTTSANYEIKKFRSNDGAIIGEFVYFGITADLRRSVNREIHQTNILNLQINCDGLPLYKSSSKEFWPILCKVHNIPDIYKPFPVAIFSGNGKPNNINSYFNDFIREINELTREGIIIDERIFGVHIMCFVCDRPARSFLKCIKGHGGYNACERCLVPGQRCQNRTVYLSVSCAKRTDKSFREQQDPEHHIDVSPLLQLEPPIDMIKQFVLDFMHQSCLGVMKKMILDFWLERNLTTRLSQNKKRLLTKFNRITITNTSRLSAYNKINSRYFQVESNGVQIVFALCRSCCFTTNIRKKIL